ncbi:MAG: glutamate synthase large subunit [Acidobacteriota bacterium]
MKETLNQQLPRRPEAQGLYHPDYEKDACGVGFIAHMKGVRSHQILADAFEMLQRMDHRGGCGCEPNTGDGAGILTALPHRLFADIAPSSFDRELPSEGAYAAGVVFLPTDGEERRFCKDTVEAFIEAQGQTLIGWRELPTDPVGADVGETALEAMPAIEQLFVASADGLSQDEFEQQLYLIRKQASQRLRVESDLQQRQAFYICSLSTKIIVFKGMLTSGQVVPFYTDLSDPRFESHLAMVHSRFSTNTFPSWDRAQPNRFMSHNGEINTLRGNRNWMRAREGVLSSSTFGSELSKCYPIVEPDCSDSGSFDNALEFLLVNGRTLAEGIMMMIPEAWQNHRSMPPEKRAFYEYHSCLMEPWDGPASIAFTDGKYIGAVLDRNGLRPSRYVLTHDDVVVMASETGVVDIEPERVRTKGRLQPGRMFLVDFEQGRVIGDTELKSGIAERNPYQRWLDEQSIDLEDLSAETTGRGLDSDTLVARKVAHGFSVETMRFMLRPLVEEQRDPLGSMGNDAALACLSEKPRVLYDYFKQLFAQVTNPSIDSIREEVIMSLECFIGPEHNLLETTAEHARRIRLQTPILSNGELLALRNIERPGYRARTLDTTWPADESNDGLSRALDRICREAEAAVDEGVALIVLSDRNMGPDRIALPALLACGAVHHHLLDTIKRTRTALIVESGEAREVHHHCLLVGYGADAINPYLAYEALWNARAEGRFRDDLLGDLSESQLVERYKRGVKKGLLKVMAKMGISTLQSYKGAQIFEAVGLASDVIERAFAGTASRLEGVSLDVLAEESRKRHALAYTPTSEEPTEPKLHNGGEFHWRAKGEQHMWSPPAIAAIQAAARAGDRSAYHRFSRLMNEQATKACTLRGLLELKAAPEPISLHEVEPVEEIVQRFCTGAMSYGSISAESHESLAVAMNRLGGKSNTGEGGEDPARYTPLPNGDSKRSAIKQVASGRFGVTSWYLTNADELQIKIAQGAKPGEGGELPGHKVDQIIAKTRHSTPGVGLISPPPHHDIYSIEDLAQLIHDLKNANPAARISVKLVSEVGVGTIAAGVAKAKADHILISGHDGGTGASPLTSIKHAGLPWELGLTETHQTLVMNDLRSRVILQTDGQLKTGRDVVVAAILGAEEFGFSTAPLITLGCIMMRKCHLNTCPVGIATQDPDLRAKFSGKPEHVVNYLFMVAEEARGLMAQLGVRRLSELVGRKDLLERELSHKNWKTEGLDLSLLLSTAQRKNDATEVICTQPQDHELELALDHELIEKAKPALRSGEVVHHELPIRNTNRTVGTMLSHELMKSRGEKGLPQGTVHFKFNGSAGQSFGAFLAKGLRLEVEGDANDYVGKGLSGGEIVVYPPKSSTFKAEDNILVGNVCLYGATSGEAYFRGQAAERFCVRNSGARAVVEGVGDHGCEYMTGGRAVILGPTGRNFAAGMSGGIAWVWDPKSKLSGRCNMEMVSLENVSEDWAEELHELVERHARLTGSVVARALLGTWDDSLRQFRQVMPDDYRRVLAQQRAA